MKTNILNSYSLTLDMDWAPECAVNYVADILIEREIKATWFVTNESDALKRIMEYDELFEFGIHPNFFSDSSHGTTEREILKSMKHLLPNANIMRTHGLYQTSRMLAMAVSDFGINIDLSLLLPLTPFITPHTIYFDHDKRGLTRIPYFWEDDLELFRPQMNSDINAYSKQVGLKIYDFHPLYIYLNYSDMKTHDAIKSKGRFHELSREDINPFINTNSKGVRDSFLGFCNYIEKKQESSYTISEISTSWKENNENRNPR